MPTNRNPSLILSQAQLDVVIDRLMEGKYCKKPPSIHQVWATGMLPGKETTVREYVLARWHLTPAGTTMRTRKLLSKMRKYVDEGQTHEDAVWKVTAGWYSNDECYVSGKLTPVLKESTWLLWGWLFADSARNGSALTFTLVGLGGNREALIRNQSLIGKIEEKIARYQREEETARQHRMRTQEMLEQVRGMNAMMTASVADEVLK